MCSQARVIDARPLHAKAHGRFRSGGGQKRFTGQRGAKRVLGCDLVKEGQEEGGDDGGEELGDDAGRQQGHKGDERIHGQHRQPQRRRHDLEGGPVRSRELPHPVAQRQVLDQQSAQHGLDERGDGGALARE